MQQTSGSEPGVGSISWVLSGVGAARTPFQLLVLRVAGDWHAYLPDWWCVRHGHYQQDLPIGAWAYYDDWAI